MESPGRYPALETEAVAVRSLSTAVLHGLLQTPDYSRGVLSATLPRHSAPELDSLIKLRELRRQALLRNERSIGDCVEVAEVADAWRLRSTTDPGVELSFDHREWLAFI